MVPDDRWKQLGWRHPVWDLLRYYCSLRGEKQKSRWLSDLTNTSSMSIGESAALPVAADDVAEFADYLRSRGKMLDTAIGHLRTEDEANAFCQQHGYAVDKTRTQSTDHHQASKALISAVSAIAGQVCDSLHLACDVNPQTRCVWCTEHGLHVTARNLDGAVPALTNPRVVWEIKEYWGKTKGGSKMSDAVYECNLVGRELRDFEQRTRHARVAHVVFVDGSEQWAHRKSDLARFVDLLHQGLIDYLLVGREVESKWQPLLEELLADSK